MRKPKSKPIKKSKHWICKCGSKFDNPIPLLYITCPKCRKPMEPVIKEEGTKNGK